VPEGVLVRLRSAAPNMSRTLRRIAEYALAWPDRVIYHSVTELAEAAGTSEGSIIRFCHDLGLKGFQEFKLKLALELGQAQSASPDRGEVRGTRDIVDVVSEDSVAAIGGTRALLDPAEVDRAAALVTAADRIDIYGVGASGMTAEYLGYKLLRLGLNARTHVDPHLAAMCASQLGGTDVAIGISSSGSTVDSVHAMRTAKAAGAATIVVVNRMKSPITRFADCVLLASTHESPLSGGGVASKMSQFYVLEVLFSVLRREMPDAEGSLRRTAEAVVDKSY